MSVLWARYLAALETKPLVTKSLTSAFLMGTGDVVAQKLIEKKKWELKRTVRAVGIGCVLTGPSLHYWYKLLDTAVVGNSTKAVIGKTVIDQTVFAPYIISLFFVSNSVLDGKSSEETVRKLKKDLLPTLYVNWTVWPLATLINFRFVPSDLRALYVSSVALVWNCYLCYVGNRH